MSTPSFHARCLSWKASLSDELTILRISKHNEEIRECSFTPVIAKHHGGKPREAWGDTTMSAAGVTFSKAATTRAVAMYVEGVRKKITRDAVSKENDRLRKEHELDYCTEGFQPTTSKYAQDKYAKEREGLVVKGENKDPNKDPNNDGDANNDGDPGTLSDVYNRLTLTQAAPSPPRNPLTRWNGNALSQVAFESSFLARQNEYAIDRGGRLEKLLEDDEERAHGSREGHWRVSYATYKRNKDEYEERSGKTVQGRRDSFWTKTSMERGRAGTYWGARPQDRDKKGAPQMPQMSDARGDSDTSDEDLRDYAFPAPTSRSKNQTTLPPPPPSPAELTLHDTLINLSSPTPNPPPLTPKLLGNFMTNFFGSDAWIPMPTIHRFLRGAVRGKAVRAGGQPEAAAQVALQTMAQRVEALFGDASAVLSTLVTHTHKPSSPQQDLVSYPVVEAFVNMCGVVDIPTHSQPNPPPTLTEHEVSLILSHLTCATKMLTTGSGISTRLLVDTMEHYSVPVHSVMREKEQVEDELAQLTAECYHRGRNIHSFFEGADLLSAPDGSFTCTMAEIEAAFKAAYNFVNTAAVVRDEARPCLKEFKRLLVANHGAAGEFFAAGAGSSPNRVTLGEFIGGIEACDIAPAPSYEMCARVFREFDKNNDGRIEWREMFGFLRREVKEADAAAKAAPRCTTILTSKVDEEGQTKALMEIKKQMLRRCVTAGSLFRDMDEDKSNRISFGEFQLGLKKMIRPIPTVASMRALFDEFDADKSNYLSWDEVNERLKKDVADDALQVQVVKPGSVVSSHRSRKNALYKTKEEYRASEFFDVVMESLQKGAEETYIPTINKPEGEDSECGSMDKFMEKMGVKGKEKEKSKRKKEKRRKKKLDAETGNISAISEADSADSEPFPAQQQVVSVRRPSVLRAHAHSLDEEFQKLHKQKHDLREKKVRNQVEETLLMERRVHMEKEAIEEEHEAVFHTEHKMGKAEQEVQVKRLSKPREKNKYEAPPPPPASDSNMNGRQRPHPEEESEGGAARVQRSDEEVAAWVKRQEIIKRKHEADVKMSLQNEDKIANAHLFKLSEASASMVKRGEGEKKRGESINLKLYKDGLKTVENKKKVVKSPYPHSPSAHLQSEVTKKILEHMVKRNDSFMQGFPKPLREEYSFSPTIPDESKRIISEDRNYNAKTREEQRVAKWVKKTVSFNEEKAELGKMRMQEYNYVLDSPGRKSREQILAEQERALHSEQKKIL